MAVGLWAKERAVSGVSWVMERVVVGWWGVGIWIWERMSVWFLEGGKAKGEKHCVMLKGV